jgi:hypothetical protein
MCPFVVKRMVMNVFNNNLNCHIENEILSIGYDVKWSFYGEFTLNHVQCVQISIINFVFHFYYVTLKFWGEKVLLSWFIGIWGNISFTIIYAF